MEELKVLAANLCITSVLFGLLRGIFPAQRYDKILKLILSILFIFLIVNGITGLVQSKADFDGITEDMQLSPVAPVETRLAETIMAHFDQMLKAEGIDCTCKQVTVEIENEAYVIRRVTISNGIHTEKAIKLIAQIGHIDEEKIYVAKN